MDVIQAATHYKLPVNSKTFLEGPFNSLGKPSPLRISHGPSKLSPKASEKNLSPTQPESVAFPLLYFEAKRKTTNPDKLPGVTTSPSRVELPQWQFKPGSFNAITDVPGVSVGHLTVRQETPHTIRTGVTAIIPHNGNLATDAVWASGGWLNGNGELTGLGYIQETGYLLSPILLTNTFSVGTVHDGVFEYYERNHPGEWAGLIPVVGECYDGFFNNIEDRTSISKQDVVKAIEAAKSGGVPQGRVGAGTGMRSFEMHAGIGSASRKLVLDGKTYTIGVLVNANHTNHDGLEKLDPVIRSKMEEKIGDLKALSKRDNLDQAKRPILQQSRQGSIITVIATDLPLMPHQLKELVNRAGLGIGAMGSTMDTTSGDGVIAFSTASLISCKPGAPQTLPAQVIHQDALSPVYRATVEAVAEAQINSILASHSDIKK
ncbi:MAG: P1 family peptidase [Cyanobacteria bacterium]|nr:P1 family peptidase [Cyanobacteriota bacterium]